jgi:hypothetical protein
VPPNESVLHCSGDQKSGPMCVRARLLSRAPGKGPSCFFQPLGLQASFACRCCLLRSLPLFHSLSRSAFHKPACWITVCPHLKILNFIMSAKALSANEGALTGSGLGYRHVFWGPPSPCYEVTNLLCCPALRVAQTSLALPRYGVCMAHSRKQVAPCDSGQGGCSPWATCRLLFRGHGYGFKDQRHY